MGTVAPFKDSIHDQSTTMFPIRQLLKKDVDFQWLPGHEKAVNKIRESEPVLRFYDPTKKVTIHADALFTGLVAYTSRVLMQTEQHWFQIEKELPELTFAAEESI